MSACLIAERLCVGRQQRGYLMLPVKLAHQPLAAIGTHRLALGT